MLDEVGCDLLQPLVCSNDLVVLAQQLFQQRGLVWVQVSRVYRSRDPVVQVEPGQAQFLPAVLVNQLDRSPIFFTAFEVVARHIVAEDAFGQLVVLEQRGAGESDKRGVGQSQPHIARQSSRLRAVCLVGYHDDVVPVAIGFGGPDVLVELVDQAENIAVVLLE